MDDMPDLWLRGVGVRLGGHDVLTDIDFDADRGDVVGLMGPNGSGKTTLLKVLAGLIVPGSGEGRVLGSPLGTSASTGVGLMLETPPFADRLSGRENLELLAYVGRPAVREVSGLLRAVGLDPNDHTPVRSYSQGMRKRLGLAQALQADPGLYLLDEPMNGLDPLGMAMMRETILALAGRQRAVVVSSHLLHELEHVCTKVYMLVGGRAQQVGGDGRGCSGLEDAYIAALERHRAQR